jgi:hypothetical protein
MPERANDGRLVAGADADRDAELTAATNEPFHRDLKEDKALEARIAARQAMAEVNELETENRILETELEAERERHDANYMGLVLAVCLILAALVVSGFWLLGRMDHGSTAYAGPATSRTTFVQPGVR